MSEEIFMNLRRAIKKIKKVLNQRCRKEKALRCGELTVRFYHHLCVNIENFVHYFSSFNMKKENVYKNLREIFAKDSFWR